MFTGVGERSREGNDLWQEMNESGVIDKTAIVFGQMNEPSGTRMRVPLTGLTMAEYFRDAMSRDVLLFIDNIFRYIQAGSEVSALLGRMPSAVGYQPTLRTTRWANCRADRLQKWIYYIDSSCLCAGGRSDGSGTGDDFAHLNAVTVLSEELLN